MHFRGAGVRLIGLLAALVLLSCMKVDPTLTISVRELDFGSRGDRLPVVVQNTSHDKTLASGVTPLSYRFRSDVEWISFDPRTGECGEGESRRHDVVINRSHLEFGVNTGIVTVSSNGGNKTINVTAYRDPPLCLDPPAMPSNPAPLDDATGVALSASLLWSDGLSTCPGLTATYDVYFGTTSPPPFHHDNGSVRSWKPDALANQTTYHWKVIAKDPNGATAGPEWSFTTEAAPCVLPPSAVALTAPANGASGVSIQQDLSWSGGTSQCAGLSATYDVYFGTASPPPLDHNNGAVQSWDPGALAYATTYYWRVVATDANGSTSSSTRSFTTEAAPCVLPPSAVALTAPANGAGGVSIQQDLSWSGGTSQCAGLTATYDVYFGTTSPPPLDHNNGAAQNWDPGALDYSTTYYWTIVARDDNGKTETAVWSFTTEDPCLAGPTAPCAPNPSDGRTGLNENTNLAWGCGDSQCAGLVATYKVYFGTNPTPGSAELLGTTAVKTWNLPRLQSFTVYYWQIVAIDANGEHAGPVWSFRTRSALQ